MRRPIQVQLLVPMLAIVLSAIAMTVAATAYWGSVLARNEQEENVRRIAATLTEASFPLTDRVLRQASGLSGAEFILLDENGNVQESTLPLERERAELPASLGSVAADELSAGREAKSGRSASMHGEPVVLLGRAYLAARFPIVGRLPRVAPGTLLLLYPEERWTARVSQATYPAFLTGLVAAAVAVVTTAILARRFVRPIHAIVEQTAAIARGEFRPVDVARRDDEISDLAASIDRMAEQLALYERETRRNERMRTLGQLGAGIAHQLRNAATGGRMAIELHRADCPLTGSDESLDVAMRQLRLMESYLQRFLTLGLPESPEREELSLNELVEEVLPLVRPMCSHGGIALEFTPSPEPVRMRGNAEALRQLVVNLTVNAVEAVARADVAERRVCVRIDRTDDAWARLGVSDAGPGPAPDGDGRLFEPFFTTKPDGTGLGLFVARQTAQAHGASIRWERRDGMTHFLVDLPLMAGA